MQKCDLQKLSVMYKCFASLYGAITSDDAFEFVREYAPSISKMDFTNDMLVRYNNKHPGYKIKKYDARHFLIYSDIYSEQEAEELINNQKGDKYYHPKNYDEFISYDKDLKWYNDNLILAKDTKHHLRDVLNSSPRFEEKFLLELQRLTNLGRDENDYLNYIMSLGIDVDKYDILVKKLIGLFREFEIYSKRHILKGFSTREIWKQKGEL